MLHSFIKAHIQLSLHIFEPQINVRPTFKKPLNYSFIFVFAKCFYKIMVILFYLIRNAAELVGIAARNVLLPTTQCVAMASAAEVVR